MNSWLWPDHQIGKRESRRLREEHNRLVNSKTELIEMLRAVYGFVATLQDRRVPTSFRPSDEYLAKITDVIGKAEAPKYEAKTQRGLFFWAEKIEIKGGPDAWNVVSQMEDYPATEAHDDWFAHFKDADDIARQLAENYTTEEDAR